MEIKEIIQHEGAASGTNVTYIIGGVILGLVLLYCAYKDIHLVDMATIFGIYCGGNKVVREAKKDTKKIPNKTVENVA